MIPKTIHYVWLGGKPYPKLVQKCIASWHHHLPEYQFIKWDESNAPLDHPYVRRALKKGYYAFASDFIRIYALYQHGGIYLDTDMEVIRPFDALLTNTCFLGYQEPNTLGAGIIGTQPFSKLTTLLLSYYDTLHHFEPIPNVIKTVIKRNQHQLDNTSLTCYDPEYFYPYNPYSPQTTGIGLMYMDITSQTYAIHHWQKSWRLSIWQRWKRSLKKRGIL